VEHAQAVAAGVEDVAFIQDHLDGEVRRGFAESATQDGEVIAIGDLVRGQTVRGNDPTAGETRDGGDVVEMLMGENDRVDLCRLHAERGWECCQGLEAGVETGIDQDRSVATFEEIRIARPRSRAELPDIVLDGDRRARRARAHALVELSGRACDVGIIALVAQPAAQRLHHQHGKAEMLADEIEKASLVHGDDAGVRLERNPKPNVAQS
jgi:hypothetical protein